MQLQPWFKIFCTTIHDFMYNTALHGYRHLVETDRHWIEKALWVIIQILATWGVVSLVLDVYIEYRETPTVTTIETNEYPVWNVPFPAVAICDVNMISKTKARAMAKRIITKNSNIQISEEDLLDKMKLIGKIFGPDTKDFDEVMKLHDLMRPYKMEDVIAELAPNCNDLLLRCMWRGSRRHCRDLFHVVNTLNGRCCVFNIVSPNMYQNASERLSSPGYKMGLSVVLLMDSSDYFYTVLPTMGAKIFAFNPFTKPDTSSDLIEHLVPLNTETFLTLSAFSRYTVNDLLSVEPETRGCLFNHESSHILQGRYNLGTCLSQCSIASIIQLCSCLPFYFTNKDSVRVCNLADIPCLAKNKEKFLNHRSRGWETSDVAAGEADDALSCDQCLPSCSTSWYQIRGSSAEIHLPLYHKSKLLEGVNLTMNHSIVHLYYSSVNSVLFKQDILYSWQELVSNFGGISSMFNGFSFVSVVEFLYFLIVRQILLAKESGEKREQQLQLPPDDSEEKKTVYWNEIIRRY